MARKHPILTQGTFPPGRCDCRGVSSVGHTGDPPRSCPPPLALSAVGSGYASCHGHGAGHSQCPHWDLRVFRLGQARSPNSGRRGCKSRHRLLLEPSFPGTGCFCNLPGGPSAGHQAVCLSVCLSSCRGWVGTGRGRAG